MASSSHPSRTAGRRASTGSHYKPHFDDHQCRSYPEAVAFLATLPPPDLPIQFAATFPTKARNPFDHEATVAAFRLFDLPSDIQYRIAGAVESNKDLTNLACASRECRELAFHWLYRHIDINFAPGAIFRTLQQRAELNRHARSLGIYNSSSSKRPRALDDLSILSDIIPQMVALETLHWDPCRTGREPHDSEVVTAVALHPGLKALALSAAAVYALADLLEEPNHAVWNLCRTRTIQSLGILDDGEARDCTNLVRWVQSFSSLTMLKLDVGDLTPENLNSLTLPNLKTFMVTALFLPQLSLALLPFLVRHQRVEELEWDSPGVVERPATSISFPLPNLRKLRCRLQLAELLDWMYIADQDAARRPVPLNTLYFVPSAVPIPMSRVYSFRFFDPVTVERISLDAWEADGNVRIETLPEWLPNLTVLDLVEFNRYRRDGVFIGKLFWVLRNLPRLEVYCGVLPFRGRMLERSVGDEDISQGSTSEMLQSLARRCRMLRLVWTTDDGGSMRTQPDPLCPWSITRRTTQATGRSAAEQEIAVHQVQIHLSRYPLVFDPEVPRSLGEHGLPLRL